MGGEHFWGRKHLIDEIGHGVLTPRPTSFSLVGAHLSGKSALLGHFAATPNLLPAQASTGWASSTAHHLRPVVVLLDCTWCTSQLDLFDLVQTALLSQLDHETYATLDWARIQPSADCLQRLWQLTLQLQPAHVRLVMLLDNFDALWNNETPLIKPGEALRLLTSNAALVMATSIPLYDLDEQLVGATALGAATQLFLGLLEADAAQQWLACYQQTYPGLGDLTALLLEITGGHPFLLRTLGDSLAEVQQMLAPGQSLSSYHMPLIRLRLAEHGRPLFVALWNSIRSLPALHHSAIIGLLDRLTRAALTPEQITREQLPALNWLINQAAIRYGASKDGYTYQLFSPLFAEFMLNRRTQVATLVGESMIQPPRAADEQIYETLTKMESVLLRYFEKHSQKLITMDQLLTDVWKRSDASTRRVQEAIRRLRLQLEQQHPAIGMIENERGRGYRFIPAHTTEHG